MTTTPSITNPSMAGKGIPIFDGKDFSFWKMKVQWYLGSIHDCWEEVLTEGPITPGTWSAEVRDDDGILITPSVFSEKLKRNWTTEDATQFRLDSKIKSIWATVGTSK